jgi:drug/metabolite transporter (DMT)-like permease
MPHSAMYASILGVAGTALLLSSAISNSLDQAVGIVVTFLAVASAAISSVFAKRELAHVDPIISTILQLFGAAILLFLASVSVERGQPSSWTSANPSALIGLGVVASSVAYPIYFWLLKGLEPWQIGTIQWFEPLVAILEGALLFRESLSWRMVGGAVILVVCATRVMTAQDKDDDAVTLQITD